MAMGVFTTCREPGCLASAWTMLQILGPTTELLCALLPTAAEDGRRGGGGGGEGGRPEEGKEAGAAVGPWADATSGVWTERGAGAVVGAAGWCNGG